MAVTLTTAARNAACAAIVALVDASTGVAAGSINFSTSAPATLCNCPMSNPAFGAPVTGVSTASAITTGTVSGSSNPSTVALALFVNRAGTEVFRCACAVATSPSDINLSNVAVNNDDTISISSLTYTVPAT